MVSNQLSIYNMLTFIYQIYQVMPAPPQFPDVTSREWFQWSITTEYAGQGQLLLARFIR